MNLFRKARLYKCEFLFHASSEYLYLIVEDNIDVIVTFLLPKVSLGLGSSAGVTVDTNFRTFFSIFSYRTVL